LVCPGKGTFSGCAAQCRFDMWVDVTADVLDCAKTAAMGVTVHSTVRLLTFC
jgi:predicted acyltransferase (DUF342 family)